MEPHAWGLFVSIFGSKAPWLKDFCLNLLLRRHPNINPLFFHRMACHLTAIFIIDQVGAINFATIKGVWAAGMEGAAGGRRQRIGDFTGDGRALLAGHF